MELEYVRQPAVAGRFYPSHPQQLARAVDEYLETSTPPGDVAGAKACIAPHAGYIYSGSVAGVVYRRLPQRAAFLLLGPNHFGAGSPLAITSRGSWRTPLGPAPIDEALARLLQQNCPGLAEDHLAHAGEHSLEVHLPFLQRRMKTFSFVPILIGDVAFPDLETLGRGLARALSGLAEPPLIIASTDMNHYEPDAVTRAKDQAAVAAILTLDPAGLYEVLRERHITMCGYGAVIAMLTAVKAMGAREAVLENYKTSGDAGGDRRSVVGYAGVIIR
ncbi:MAG: AmmeMemoRadiSam system protein B [Terriglobia bacterium]